MTTKQFLIRVPNDIAARFRVAIPARERNKFIVELLQKAVRKEEGELAEIARAVTAEEQKGALKKELAIWDITTGDGLDN